MNFVENLSLVREQLTKFSAHDTFFLLRNCLFMPRLLHVLRISPSFTRSDKILNVKLDTPKTAQVSLPTKHGGFGICSNEFLTASAFFGLFHAADPTGQAISNTWDLNSNDPNWLPFLSGALKVSLQTSRNKQSNSKVLKCTPSLSSVPHSLLFSE